MPAPDLPPPIPTIPPAPSRSAPADFSPKADSWAGTWGPATSAANVNFSYVAQAIVYIDAQITGATTVIGEARDAAVVAVNAARDQGVETLEAIVANAGFSGTSTTSLSVGTGNKTLTTQAGLAFQPGSFVLLADQAAPTTNYMIGQVSAYNSGSGAMTVAVTVIGGDGTKTAWNVVSSSRPGQNGSDAAVTKNNIEAALGGVVAMALDNTNFQTGTSYTVQASDLGRVIDLFNAAEITLTLPDSLPVGFNCLVRQSGAGQVLINAASGASRRNRQSHTRLAGQWSEASLSVRSNSGGSSAEWVLSGDTAA